MSRENNTNQTWNLLFWNMQSGSYLFRIGLHDALHSLHIFLFPPISFLTSFSHCLEAFLLQLCNKLYLNHVQISRLAFSIENIWPIRSDILIFLPLLMTWVSWGHHLIHATCNMISNRCVKKCLNSSKHNYMS